MSENCDPKLPIITDNVKCRISYKIKRNLRSEYKIQSMVETTLKLIGFLRNHGKSRKSFIGKYFKLNYINKYYIQM